LPLLSPGSRRVFGGVGRQGRENEVGMEREMEREMEIQ
jgi:hypothetical protein